MGRKSKFRISLKPFCYYCDKQFNNESILYQHQKAKHFGCTECRKRCSTGPSLSDHVRKVHNHEIYVIPNAIHGRNSIEMAIYGMDGVPMSLIDYKLKLKAEEKKKKLNKKGEILELDPDMDARKLKKKEKIFSQDTNVYYNPNIINIARSNDQIKALRIMSNNLPNVNNLLMSQMQIPNTQIRLNMSQMPIQQNINSNAQMNQHVFNKANTGMNLSNNNMYGQHIPHIMNNNCILQNNMPIPQMPNNNLPLPMMPNNSIPIPQMPNSSMPIPQMPNSSMPIPQMPNNISYH